MTRERSSLGSRGKTSIGGEGFKEKNLSLYAELRLPSPETPRKKGGVETDSLVSEELGSTPRTNRSNSHFFHGKRMTR